MLLESKELLACLLKLPHLFLRHVLVMLFFLLTMIFVVLTINCYLLFVVTSNVIFDTPIFAIFYRGGSSHGEGSSKGGGAIVSRPLWSRRTRSIKHYLECFFSLCGAICILDGSLFHCKGACAFSHVECMPTRWEDEGRLLFLFVGVIYIS